MRRVGLLIDHLRRATENEGGGIADSEFIQYLNDAQDRIQSLIFQTHPESDVFASEGFISLVSGQEKYSLETMEDENGNSFSSNIFATNSLTSVERRESDAFYVLKMISNHERRTGWGYILRDKNILVAPIPNGNFPGGLRIVYIRRLDNLDKRRGLVLSSAANSITLDTGTFPLSSDTDFVDNEWITVVDADGNVKQQEIRVSSFSDPTITTSTTIDTSAVVAGDYVVQGKFSTTHSDLKDVVERYLLKYAETQIYMRDTSRDYGPAKALLAEMESEIVGLYAGNQSDVPQIPISSTDYMIW